MRSTCAAATNVSTAAAFAATLALPAASDVQPAMEQEVPVEQPAAELSDVEKNKFVTLCAKMCHGKTQQLTEDELVTVCGLLGIGASSVAVGILLSSILMLPLKLAWKVVKCTCKAAARGVLNTSGECTSCRARHN